MTEEEIRIWVESKWKEMEETRFEVWSISVEPITYRLAGLNSLTGFIGKINDN